MESVETGPQCTAAIRWPGYETTRCALPPGPHRDVVYGEYHQAPSPVAPGGLTLWRDNSTYAIPAAA